MRATEGVNVKTEHEVQLVRSGVRGERDQGRGVGSAGYSSWWVQRTFRVWALEEFIWKNRCQPKNEMLDNEVTEAVR